MTADKKFVISVQPDMLDNLLQIYKPDSFTSDDGHEVLEYDIFRDVSVVVCDKPLGNISTNLSIARRYNSAGQSMDSAPTWAKDGHRTLLQVRIALLNAFVLETLITTMGKDRPFSAWECQDDDDVVLVMGDGNRPVSARLIDGLTRGEAVTALVTWLSGEAFDPGDFCGEELPLCDVPQKLSSAHQFAGPGWINWSSIGQSAKFSFCLFFPYADAIN